MAYNSKYTGYEIDDAIGKVGNKLDQTGDASNTTVDFEEATDRLELNKNDKLSVLMGKISKWLKGLKNVAFSGSYNDLNDRPTIPTVPTNVSAFTNDAGYISGFTESDPTVPSHVKDIKETDITNWNNKSNFSGKYDDLTGKPTIPSAYTLPTASESTLGGVKVGAGLSMNNGVLSTTGGGTADSVDWSNVQNKPTIPTATSQLTNDSGFISDASNFATKDKYGDTTINVGRKENTTTGDFSVATGTNSTATGYASSAQNLQTTSYGTGAHAEGAYTIANNNFSHAEGYSTIAFAEGSHAEGAGTRADAPYSHVQGKYNVIDSNGEYVHIVGNGSSDSARSNAHTIKGNGETWFQGDVYVGSTSGTNKDAGSKKLATETYVDDAVANAGGANITASTTDLEDGVSALPTGTLYVVYEE